MDLTLILAAAEVAEHAAGEEHHKSEMPFFVSGGLLATYAVVVSVYGFRDPDFPDNAAAARGVMSVGIVLSIAAVFCAIYVAI
jgi:hypothetical protein